MHDPATRIILVIAIILLIDHFAFHGTLLDVTGRFVLQWANWIAGFVGG